MHGEVAEKFGANLRHNLKSLDAVGLIPFQAELEHTKVYAKIEMVHFDYIRMEYDIRNDDFSQPALSDQADKGLSAGLRSS